MKFAAAAVLALGLMTGVATARPVDGIFTEITQTAPRSVFDDIRDTAPRSVFDDIKDSAPRSAGDEGGVKQDLVSE